MSTGIKKEGYILMDDPESGQLYWEKKEVWEARRKWHDDLMSRLVDMSKKIAGSIQITSTPADSSNDEDFKNLWMDQPWH